jgi:hypothetical protein
MIPSIFFPGGNDIVNIIYFVLFKCNFIVELYIQRQIKKKKKKTI